MKLKSFCARLAKMLSPAGGHIVPTRRLVLGFCIAFPLSATE
jgi:hypothetical protein